MSAIVDWIKDVFSISSNPKPKVSKPSGERSTDRGIRAPRISRGNGSGTRIETIAIKSYSEASEIADILRNDITAVINVGGMSGTDRARLVDFMSGLKAGLLAQSNRVSEDVYILAPANAELEPASDHDEEVEADDSRLVIRP